MTLEAGNPNSASPVPPQFAVARAAALVRAQRKKTTRQLNSRTKKARQVKQ